MYTSIAAGVIAFITYFHPTFWVGSKKLLEDLFTKKDMMDDQDSNLWHGNGIGMLLGASVMRMLVFIVFVTAPVPSGVFSPSVLIGGIIGRLYGEIAS
jgi:H+/Cl- antiporter ClcA